MANSLVVHGAIFAVGALVGGGIASTIARKNETTSSQGITRPQQPVAPILQVGTTGNAVIISDAGVVSPPLKYGNPGAWSPTLLKDIFPYLCSGPITDQLVRRAYVAGYDRRLRHPAWVRHVVLTHIRFSDPGNRQQNTSPNRFCAKILAPKVRTLATGRRATSWRMKVYRRCSVPNCRITSEVGTTGDIWFLRQMPSCPRKLWMKRSCCPTLRRRLASGSTVIVSYSVNQLLVLPTDDLHLDWAYVEDWCRRLTGSFSDVYIFTIPLYLPKQDLDGKWRVASIFLDAGIKLLD